MAVSEQDREEDVVLWRMISAAGEPLKVRFCFESPGPCLFPSIESVVAHSSSSMFPSLPEHQKRGTVLQGQRNAKTRVQGEVEGAGRIILTLHQILKTEQCRLVFEIIQQQKEYFYLQTPRPWLATKMSDWYESPSRHARLKAIWLL